MTAEHDAAEREALLGRIDSLIADVHAEIYRVASPSWVPPVGKGEHRGGTTEARDHLMLTMVASAGMDWRMRWDAQKRLGWSFGKRLWDLIGIG